MAELIYSTICSIDLYTADEEGKFDWAAPDDEVHRFVNEQERPVGTYLYGRRTYEVMTYWATAETGGGTAGAEYAEIWQAADKVVYSSTLGEVTTPRTKLEREFDPERIRALKESSPRDLGIGGPTLATAALEAGLVDQLHLLLVPEVIGGGLAALPDGLRASLELRDERRFGSGTVSLRYRARR